MEESYRNNICEFSIIFLDKVFDMFEDNKNEFKSSEFTYYIFKQLFNIDINSSGYGLDSSTLQMTNDMGDLKIYNEIDPKKEIYLEDIKNGDLVFFHTQAHDSNSPTPNNYYPGHVGIYLGNKDFIHVSDEDEKVVIDKIEGIWLSKLVASRDIIKEIIYNNLNNKWI